MESNSDAPHDMLDADELLALGLRASAAGDGGSALAYLKTAIARQPRHARAHWALAAEYASLRMPERAAEHFARTVQLDPAQPIARFQYGLLRLTSGDAAGAESIWQALDELPAGDPVRRFRDGLICMVQDRFDEALALLRAAAADPATDPALRRDMQMTVRNIEAARGAPSSTPAPMHQPAEAAAEPADVSAQSHLALTAYTVGGRH